VITLSTPHSPGSRRNPVVVVGTVGHDCHVAGSTVLNHALVKAGFETVFLRALADPQEFIDAAKESAADAIWVSSLYGMGRLDLEDFRSRCIESGLSGVLLYVGGVLVTDPEEWPKTEGVFKTLGFDRVYPPGTTPEQALADLTHDLKQRGAM
jgi:methylaspartate mutase sigma subunit